eukprot:210173_1
MSVTKEGYLWKASLYLRKLRKRWVILKGSTLYCFEDHGPSKQTETINLAQFHDVMPSKTENALFALKAQKDSATRFFRASSYSEMEQWVKCIKEAISKSRHNENNKSDLPKPTFYESIIPNKKEGYLLKESSHFKKMRKRWIVLKSKIMHCFEDALRNKPTEKIYLSEFDNVQYCKSYPTQFILINKQSKKKRCFQAGSVCEMEEWVQCIRQAMTIQSNEHENLMEINNEMKQPNNDALNNKPISAAQFECYGIENCLSLNKVINVLKLYMTALN